MAQGRYVQLSEAQPTEVWRRTQPQLDKIARRLNQRPRKTLGFQTPASKLRATVAPTH